MGFLDLPKAFYWPLHGQNLFLPHFHNQYFSVLSKVIKKKVMNEKVTMNYLKVWWFFISPFKTLPG